MQTNLPHSKEQKSLALPFGTWCDGHAGASSCIGYHFHVSHFSCHHQNQHRFRNLHENFTLVPVTRLCPDCYSTLNREEKKTRSSHSAREAFLFCDSFVTCRNRRLLFAITEAIMLSYMKYPVCCCETSNVEGTGYLFRIEVHVIAQLKSIAVQTGVLRIHARDKIHTRLIKIATSFMSRFICSRHH